MLAKLKRCSTLLIHFQSFLLIFAHFNDPASHDVAVSLDVKSLRAIRAIVITRVCRSVDMGGTSRDDVNRILCLELWSTTSPESFDTASARSLALWSVGGAVGRRQRRLVVALVVTVDRLHLVSRQASLQRPSHCKQRRGLESARISVTDYLVQSVQLGNK